MCLGGTALFTKLVSKAQGRSVEISTTSNALRK